MPYETSLSFDSVVVIESLPNGDLKSGTELFEQVIAPVAVNDPTLVVELYKAADRREFFACLRAVAQLAAEHGNSPILHLETHGSRAGLQFGDGSRATWEEVAAPLGELNRVTEMNLLAFAGLCHGWSMTDILKPTGRAPVFGMIGPMEEVEAGALLAASKVFYERLLEPQHDLRAALDTANGSTAIEDWRFKWMSAELMFCRVFEAYMAEVSREQVRTERVNRLVADITRARNLDLNQTMQLRSSITADLDDHETWFHHYRDHFLLLDEYPENSRRFQLTYSDCVGREA